MVNRLSIFILNKGSTKRASLAPLSKEGGRQGDDVT